MVYISNSVDYHYVEWWYGPVLCKAAPYQGIAVSSSVNTLAVVALERYEIT